MENKKEKVSSLKEEKCSLLGQVNFLELDAEPDKSIISKLYKRIDTLKSEAEELCNEKDDLIGAYTMKMEETNKKGAKS